ncbi:AraC family transcriptional regulator [Proteiniphilum sp. X52]|uniref:helix-turn-helix domain-containing protein n=1 Tax=Proteiniphilum sp. X52 TaxID=2382159 RepID=UPI000F09A87D|nr:helix-turn-helix domain-containing protein [Proteiniphilum sp. X52]RNC63438.1 AraC family transcriptional regulator [Proteiniphilum sp. X52]
MARKLHHIRSVADYNAIVGAPTEHPLLSVVHFDELTGMQDTVNRFDVYGIFLRDDHQSNLVYGTSHYEYSEGTLICVAPGQVGGAEERGQGGDIRGWALLFAHDFVRGTYLEQQMQQFHFFSYSSNEALLMAPEERQTIVDCLRRMRSEIRGKRDEAQQPILISLLDLILQYCRRFYIRQFKAMQPQSTDLLTRFEHLLAKYYDENRQAEHGLPTVKYCASELCLSPNYFGDLIRETTGKSASQTIRDFVLDRAKSCLVHGLSTTETAYTLGFNYPQHFTRAFKQRFGLLPSEYQKK